MLHHSRALVLFSGGQDSTTCLAWALDRYEHVETVGFDYGQRHIVEMKARENVLTRLRVSFPDWASRLGGDHVLSIPVLGAISDTALTRDSQMTLSASGLPNTFVPGRNLLFFVVASALAYRRGLKNIVGGMCETDFSGYPDCRDDAIKAQQVAVNIGTDSRFTFETPLMWIDKAATWALADRLGGAALVDLIVDETHTCYLGDRRVKHSWGYGCGTCPACELRKSGFERWRQPSP
jgi:7-cyano-7-deazaguanine synthase